MKKRGLEIGDVVQLNPKLPQFGGMLLVVTEPKEWGCQGYLLSTFNFEAVRFHGAAYIRTNWEEMEYVGKIVWNLSH